MNPRLSILLATVVGRADLFAKLHAHILKQAEGRSVEILVDCDNKEVSIGAKRQRLLEKATGDYVCYVDDDDMVSDDYVDKLLVAIEQDKDCVGFLITCTFNGGAPKKAITSMRYPVWCENRDGYDFCRSIYHKSVVKRSIALQAGFPDLRYGEDKVFSQKVMKLVRTEAFIPSVLYFYKFKHEDFRTKYGFGGTTAPQRRPGRMFDRRGRRVG